MNNKISMFLVLSLILCASLIGCNIIQSNQIVGTWVNQGLFGIETELTFGRDGSYTERMGGLSITGTYSIDGNRIIVTTPLLGTVVYSNFRISGNRLSYTFMGTEYIFTRR